MLGLRNSLRSWMMRFVSMLEFFIRSYSAAILSWSSCEHLPFGSGGKLNPYCFDRSGFCGAGVSSGGSSAADSSTVSSSSSSSSSSRSGELFSSSETIVSSM
uniref:Putative secreted peptide n=1 Tax=Anopheles braziliensis TaxID=58242 RepID=A0A2M3ZVR3_9DIPT